jgi:hypothetical protein
MIYGLWLSLPVSYMFLFSTSFSNICGPKGLKKKSTVDPLTGRRACRVVKRGGSHIFYTVGGKVFNLTRQPRFTLPPRKIPDTDAC